jgi:hypothetical protein
VEGNDSKSPTQQVEAAREAFEQEFERFSRFTGSAAVSGVVLVEGENDLRALRELRTRHLGRKSSLAACKKLIGRVEPDARASFGQLVQRIELEISDSLDRRVLATGIPSRYFANGSKTFS